MDDPYANLIKWLSESPKTFISDKLKTARTSDTGNSIFAGSNISRNEKLISVPPQLNLNFSTILQHLQRHIQQQDEEGTEDPVSQFYSQLSYEEVISLSSFQLISLYLLLESQRDVSFWKPFIDVLPPFSDFENIPFTWCIEGDSKQFERLPSTVKLHSLRQLNNFEKDFKLVQELIGTKHTKLIISKSSFLRFWLCCNSRCLYMKLPKEFNKTEEDNFTMVPLVDFLNHDIEEECRVNASTHEGFQVFGGPVGYKAGDQIYLSYGPHSNEFLLCEYGFIMGQDIKNKWNSIDITPQILSILKNSPAKEKFLKENGYWGDYFINTEVSYRIEVALLVVQEDDIKFMSNSPPRRLTNFIQGLTNGECYKQKNCEILKEILGQILQECEINIEMKTLEGDYRDILIQRLYKDIKEIALTHFNSI